MAAAGGWLLWRGLTRDPKRGQPRCPGCWYNMTGVADLRCPECGRSLKSTNELRTRRRSWPLTLSAVLILTLGLATALTPRLRSYGVVSLLPTMGLIWYLPQADEREPSWLERRSFAEFSRRFEDETTSDWENRWVAERMGFVRVRPLWPIGEPLTVRAVEPDILKAPFALAEVHLGGPQIAGESPSAAVATAARMPPTPDPRPGIVTQRFSASISASGSSLSGLVMLRSAARLPLGPYKLDLVLQQISPPLPPAGGATPARTPRQFRVTRPFTIVAAHDDVVAPVDTPEIRAAINRSLRVRSPHVTGREGTTPGQVGAVIFEPNKADSRLLADIAVFVRIEVLDETQLYHGGVVSSADRIAGVELREPGSTRLRALQQDWVRFAPEHLARIRVRFTGVASVADLPRQSEPLHRSRFPRLTDSIPRRVLDRFEADRYWNGTIELTLAELLARPALPK